MRFQVKDLLAVTAVAALLLLLVRGYAQVRQQHMEIARGRERLAVAEQELAIAKANPLGSFRRTSGHLRESFQLHASSPIGRRHHEDS
ncbi:MAG: hypothetical protein AAF483_30070, partial [Planctomycetota bacterium]